MSKIVRAKFKVGFVTDFGTFKKVEMNAVYSHDRNSEDNQFSNATPSGKLEMTITNPETADFLQPEKSYYLDFSEAPE